MTNFRDSVMTIAIMSLFYAAWELFFKQAYYDWIGATGEFLTFGTVAFGYALVMVTGFIVAKIIVRRKRRPQQLE